MAVSPNGFVAENVNFVVEGEAGQSFVHPGLFLRLHRLSTQEGNVRLQLASEQKTRLLWRVVRTDVRVPVTVACEKVKGALLFMLLRLSFSLASCISPSHIAMSHFEANVNCDKTLWRILTKFSKDDSFKHSYQSTFKIKL